MATAIYVVSMRYGTEIGVPGVYLTEKEANQRADNIIKEVLQQSYEENTGRNSSRLSLKKLVKWAEENGYGDSRYFDDGSDDATELLVTEHEI